jgi:hypothetical protein
MAPEPLTDSPWPQRTLPHTDITVGPCAWRLPMLAGPDRDYVQSRPSLIVVDPTDADAVLEQAVPQIESLPLLLGIAEPAFARQLESTITRRMQQLNRQHVDAVVLHVDDPAEIKSGGMLQTLFAMRDAGGIGCVGLAHPDAAVAEWLSMNAAVRLLGVKYSLDDLVARHRALPSAEEYGMSAYVLNSPQDDRAMRFALAESHRVLPVLDRPIPAGLMAMSADEVEAVWRADQQKTPPPPPLKRGMPPMAEG